MLGDNNPMSLPRYSAQLTGIQLHGQSEMPVHVPCDPQVRA